MLSATGLVMHRGVGALAAGVCALGLSVVGLGVAAPAWAAPADTSGAAKDTQRPNDRSPTAAPIARSVPSGHTTAGRRGKPAAAQHQNDPRPAAATAGSAREAADPIPDVPVQQAEPSPATTAPVRPSAYIAPTRRPPAYRAVLTTPTLPAPVLPTARAVAAASPAAALPSPAAAGTISAAATGVAVPSGNAVGTAPGQSFGDFINGVLLMVRRLFFNQVPTAAPVQALVRPSGQTWGFVAASDPEGEQITYTVGQAPRLGTVAITGNGVYTYTPGPNFAGSDAFTVTIQNPGFHINLLNLFAPQRRDVTVKVTASGGSGSVIDTFDGTAGSPPNSALWGYHLGPYRDEGLQTYTNSADNVRLDGQGNLVIQARETADGYTSTRLVTQDKLAMQYGGIQARIKMPAGQGIWPAFWMLGTSYYPENWTVWPECGEIDIMELAGSGTTYNVALHGPQGDTDYYGGAEASGQFVGTRGPISAVAPISDLTEDFHDYWLAWRQDQMIVGVDDTMLAEFTPASLPQGAQWVFNQPMYAILQVAVGGPWPGPPDATTPWPATMLVDSFRYTPLR